MTKSKITMILLIVGSALMIAGVSLWGWMTATEPDRNVINIDLSDGKDKSVTFEGLSMVPGDEREYKVALNNEHSNKYDLELDFVELENKTLKNFARVKIISGEEVIYDELLATAFEQEDIVFHVDFTEKKNTELTFVYYLPIEVGNEAKNAEALFELIFTASDE